jgi:L-threonylcarbamoyladenylate synthase
MTSTIVIKQSQSSAVEIACQALMDGGVIAFATDTVYGVGCMLNNAAAIERIYAIKERSMLEAIPVLIGNLAQLQQITTHISDSAKRFTEKFWPGALTVILKKNSALPDVLTVYDTVGVRMPDHKWLRELIDACGPLAVTSANISDEPSLATADEVLASLGGRIDLLVDGGHCDGGVPSTVVDCSIDTPKILRDGAIADAVLEFIQS